MVHGGSEVMGGGQKNSCTKINNAFYQSLDDNFIRKLLF